MIRDDLIYSAESAQTEKLLDVLTVFYNPFANIPFNCEEFIILLYPMRIKKLLQREIITIGNSNGWSKRRRKQEEF
jgi:hypothetical protein